MKSLFGWMEHQPSQEGGGGGEFSFGLGIGLFVFVFYVFDLFVWYFNFEEGNGWKSDYIVVFNVSNVSLKASYLPRNYLLHLYFRF